MSAIIFDFDGTIADSFETIVQIFYELTGGKKVLTNEERERLRGRPLRDVGKELHVRSWQVPLLVFRGRRKMAKRMRSIQPHKGIAESLAHLHAEGHELFIASSNSRSNVMLFLAQHQLESFFVSIYGGAGLFSKERLLHRVVRNQGLQSAETWYVGDEVRDIVAAKHEGLKIIAVTWGFNNLDVLSEHNPDVVVDQPADILTVLNNS